MAGEAGKTPRGRCGDPRGARAGKIQEFEAEARLTFARPAYEIPAAIRCPRRSRAPGGDGLPAETVGMSFWTDAAVLGAAGIPTVLFGPGGAGLHGRKNT